MALKIYRVKNETEAAHMLGGGINLPFPVDGVTKVYGLHDLTLVFTSPSVTVTFSDATNAGLLTKDILDAINAAGSSELKATVRDKIMYIGAASGAADTELDCASSTAAAKLGFPTTGSVAGQVYDAPGGVTPTLISVSSTGLMDGLILVTKE